MSLRERQEVQALPRPDRLTRARRRAAGSIAAAAVAAPIAYLSSDAGLPGVACPFRAATGLLCPFCGSTRACRALLDGDIAAAAALNPLGAALAIAGVGFFLWVVVIPLLGGGPVRTVRAPRWLAWAAGGLIAAVWVLRNVPGWWPLPVTA